MRTNALSPMELKLEIRKSGKRGYPGGIGWDDEAVLRRIVEDYRIKSLLEFGPGVSSRIFLECGIECITTCEHEPRWLEAARLQFKGDPRVRVIRYENLPEVRLTGRLQAPGWRMEEGNLQPPASSLQPNFDAAFVDSPPGCPKTRIEHPGQAGMNRLNTLRCALRHAPLVFLHDARRQGEQMSLATLTKEGCVCEMIQTHKGIARITR